MARGTNVLQECDICGFEYRKSIMRLNSSGLLVCPEDYEGSYDFKSHPQNKTPSLIREEPWIANARPEDTSPGGAGANLVWNTATLVWNNVNKNWNNV